MAMTMSLTVTPSVRHGHETTGITDLELEELDLEELEDWSELLQTQEAEENHVQGQGQASGTSRSTKRKRNKVRKQAGDGEAVIEVDPGVSKTKAKGKEKKGAKSKRQKTQKQAGGVDEAAIVPNTSDKVSKQKKGAKSKRQKTQKQAGGVDEEAIVPNTSDKVSKQKKVYRKMDFKAQDAIDAAADIVEKILKEVPGAPIFGMKSGCGKDCQELASAILAGNAGGKSQYFKDISKKLIETVNCSAAAGNPFPIGPRSQEAIWTSFHQVRINQEVFSHWNSFLQKCTIDCVDHVARILLDHVLRSSLAILVSKRTEAEQVIEASEKVVISVHDAQVLRYVAGYIPFSLLKYYRKIKNVNARDFEVLVKSWSVADDDRTVAESFMSYSRCWINLQNRGGLFNVNDTVFVFFISLEKVTKSMLTTKNVHKLRESNVKGELRQKIKANSSVNTNWLKIIAGMSNKVNYEPLFLKVIDSWINLRTKAFVNVYNELMQLESKASKRGEKGLRKGLSKK